MRFHKEEMDRIFNFEGPNMDRRISEMMRAIMVTMLFALAGPLVLFCTWLLTRK